MKDAPPLPMGLVEEENPRPDAEIDPIKSKLLEMGFMCREYPPDGAMLRKCMMFRKLDDVYPVCQANGKLWFYITMFVFERPGTSKVSITCEYEVAGQTITGDWVNLEMYGINIKDVLSKLEASEHRLVEAWKAVNT